MGDSGGSPDSRIWKKWSITHKLSRPASSAAVAILETTGPICSDGQGNVVMPMPSLMNASLFLRVRVPVVSLFRRVPRVRVLAPASPASPPAALPPLPPLPPPAEIR